LSKFKIGRWILLKFPQLFTFGAFKHGGPTQAAIDGTSFEYDFYGEGYSTNNSSKKPDLTVHTRIAGPEPGYVLTPICAVQSALLLLEARSGLSTLPFQGGVYTPGAIFGQSNLIERLTNAGCKFSVVDPLKK